MRGIPQAESRGLCLNVMSEKWARSLSPWVIICFLSLTPNMLVENCPPFRLRELFVGQQMRAGLLSLMVKAPLLGLAHIGAQQISVHE